MSRKHRKPNHEILAAIVVSDRLRGYDEPPVSLSTADVVRRIERVS